MNAAELAILFRAEAGPIRDRLRSVVELVQGKFLSMVAPKNVDRRVIRDKLTAVGKAIRRAIAVACDGTDLRRTF